MYGTGGAESSGCYTLIAGAFHCFVLSDGDPVWGADGTDARLGTGSTVFGTSDGGYERIITILH